MWYVYMYVLYLSSTCVAFATQSSYTPVEQALVPGYKVIHRLCLVQQKFLSAEHSLAPFYLYGDGEEARTLSFSFSFLVFVPSHLLCSPFCSLSLLVVTQIRGHIAGSSPPLPTTVRALHFYRENSSDLPSSTRVDFYVVGYCLHIKPFLVYIPNISSSTPSALPDSSCLQVEKYKFCGQTFETEKKQTSLKNQGRQLKR